MHLRLHSIFAPTCMLVESLAEQPCSKSILIYPLRSILYTDKLINIMTITLICSINLNSVLREHVNLITFPFIPFLDSSSFICRLVLCTSRCCLPENKSLPFSWALSCYPDTLSLMLTAPLSQGGSLIRKKKSSGLHQANKKATGRPSSPHHPLSYSYIWRLNVFYKAVILYSDQWHSDDDEQM